MQCMVTWQFHDGKLHEVLAQFAAMTEADERAMLGDGVRLVGRWHDLVRGTGVAIFETESVAALSRYALHWNHAMDLDIAIVLDDEETRAVGREFAE